MSVQESGPLPQSLLVAALSRPRVDTRRTRGWMRRRGLRPVVVVETTAPGEVRADAVSIDSAADFIACHHPGCCALRPVDGGGNCAVCGRR